MCFAGEAALFFGLGTVVIEQSAGQYLPGTKITDVRIQGFIVFLGLYYLVSFIAGLHSVLRRHRCSALVAYAQMLLDFVLSACIAVITWWAGGLFKVFA
jgi:hypothetical protein